MPDIPDIATFAIEQDGEEHDVVVGRKTVEDAIAPKSLTDEIMAGWLQDNLDALSTIARVKLANAPGSRQVEITTEDWLNA